jgi:hypothetical protein
MPGPRQRGQVGVHVEQRCTPPCCPPTALALPARRLCACCGAALLGCKHAWVTNEGHWLLAVPCELLGSWSDRTEVGEEVSL